MNIKTTIKRITLFVIGLFIMSFGIALIKFSSLGVTPISSIPNIFYEKFQFISFGTYIILLNIGLIIGQLIILGKDFEIKELLQLPISLLFGFFTDVSLNLLDEFEVHSYLTCLIVLIIGIIVLALGISFTLIANIILNSGEAFIKAISKKYNKEFGKIKVLFDVSCVFISMFFSLIFFSTIIGTREGTIISAVFTGFFVNKILCIINKHNS